MSEKNFSFTLLHSQEIAFIRGGIKVSPELSERALGAIFSIGIPFACATWSLINGLVHDDSVRVERGLRWAERVVPIYTALSQILSANVQH